MAGQASGGQQLTPSPNVVAPAGRGGDLWGANGGGIQPYVSPEPVAATLSNGETATNYQTQPALKVPVSGMAQESTGVLGGQIADSSLPAGNSNSG